MTSKKAPIRPFAATAQVGAAQRAAAPAQLRPSVLRRQGTTEELASALAAASPADPSALVASVPTGPGGLAATHFSSLPQAHRRIDTEEQLRTVAIGETVLVSTQLFGDNPANAREFYISSEVDETAQSILKNGQDVAIGAWVEDGKVLPIDGGKRLRAARAVSVTHLKVEIDKPPANRIEAWAKSRRLNRERSTHTIYDEAVRFKQFLDSGEAENQDALASIIARSDNTTITQGYVSQIVAIAAIPRRLMARLVEIKALTSKNAAYAISRLFTKDSLEKLAMSEPDPTLADAGAIAAERITETIILTATEKPEMTSADVRAIVSKALGESTRAPRAKTHSEPTALGSWQAKLTVIPEHKMLRVEFHDIEETDMESLRQRLKSLLEGERRP